MSVSRWPRAIIGAKGRCREPIFVKEIALRTVRPSIAYRHRVGYLGAGDNHRVTLDSRIRPVEFVVGSGDCGPARTTAIRIGDREANVAIDRDSLTSLVRSNQQQCTRCRRLVFY